MAPVAFIFSGLDRLSESRLQPFFSFFSSYRLRHG